MSRQPQYAPDSEAAIEERTCTCGAGHGSGEGHTDWCAFEQANQRLLKAVKARADALRSWADFVEQGYEVPAAGRLMREVADELELQETRTRELRKALIELLEITSSDPRDYETGEFETTAGDARARAKAAYQGADAMLAASLTHREKKGAE